MDGGGGGSPKNQSIKNKPEKVTNLGLKKKKNLSNILQRPVGGLQQCMLSAILLFLENFHCCSGHPEHPCSHNTGGICKTIKGLVQPLILQMRKLSPERLTKPHN